MKPIAFAIVGAQKAATTALFEMLRQHPGSGILSYLAHGNYAEQLAKPRAECDANPSFFGLPFAARRPITGNEPSKARIRELFLAMAEGSYRPDNDKLRALLGRSL